MTDLEWVYLIAAGVTFIVVWFAAFYHMTDNADHWGQYFMHAFVTLIFAIACAAVWPLVAAASVVASIGWRIAR